jgi:ADP-heptose:LPS heptosyltransferase
MSNEKLVQYKCVKKILLVCTGDLCEVIDIIPLMRNIKENWPDKILHILVNMKNKPVFENSSLADEVRTISDTVNFQEQLKTFQSLGNSGYDLVVVCTPKAPVYIGVSFMKADYKMGLVLKDKILDWASGRSLFKERYEIDYKAELEQSKKVPHQVELGLKLGENMGLNITNRDIVLSPSKEDERFINELMKNWKWERNKKIFGIHLSEDWIAQGWDQKDFHTMVQNFQRGYPSNILFTARSASVDIARELAKSYIGNESIRFAMDLPLLQWAELMKRCSYMIAIDKDAVQLASSQKAPVIAIFPQDNFEINAQRWAPWRVKNRKLLQKQAQKLINEIFASIKELDELY